MDIPATDAEAKFAVADAMSNSLLDQDNADRAHRMPRAPKNGLAPSLERKRMRLYLTQISLDVGALLGSFALASSVSEVDDQAHAMLLAYLKLPIFLTIALYGGSYTLRTLTAWRLGSFKTVSALLVASALLGFLAFFGNFNIDFSRAEFGLGMTLTIIAMVLSRFLMGRWIESNWGPSVLNRLVIDAGGPEVPMPNVYRINAREHALSPSIDDPAALDRLAQYLRNMDEVLVSCPQTDQQAWSEVLKGSGVHGEVISSYAREIGALGIIHHDDAALSTLLVSTGPLALRARAMKRVFDIVVSGFALLALAPLFAACAIMIKAEDGGTVFFRQRRMGRGNRFFEIYKFRSMREEHSDADGNRSASKDDDRITKIGRLLRKTSVDELPQLINVLKGDMSLVGPRPHALGSQAGKKLFWQIDRRYWQRHCLRPGITGLAQVRGFRGATDTEEDLTSRLQADLEYVQGWTILRDVHVLLSTLKVLVHDRAF